MVKVKMNKDEDATACFIRAKEFYSFHSDGKLSRLRDLVNWSP